MHRTLLNITDDLRALDDLLAECGGDISDPAVEAAMRDWMAELDNDLNTKVDNYAALITEMQARAQARKDEADRLANRARIDQNNAARMKEFLRVQLEIRGIAKVETDRYRVSIQKNGGRPGVDVSVPAQQLPPRFQKVTVDADKAAILEAIQAGEDVDGCSIMPRGTSMRIK